MWWWDFLLALVVAVLGTALLVALLSWVLPARGDTSMNAGTTALFLFLLLFVGVWAVGLWLGPSLAWGGRWLAYVLAGVVLVLIIAAVAPPPPRRAPRTPEEASALSDAAAEAERAARSESLAAFGVFFWILILVLITAVIVAYAT